ncbi:MAG: hypothetical protein HYS53_02970 [Candidatus Aenigmarchaeota archaeon]|nr:hypothetical protein [Candidatus Aenigmarchaeota archaeon]
MTGSHIVGSDTDEGVLNGKSIFIAAGFPRNGAGYSVKPFEITNATVSASRATLRHGGDLIVSYHPTLTPLIMSVGDDFLPGRPENRRPFVHVYQSELYRRDPTEEERHYIEKGVGEMHWIPAADANGETGQLNRFKVKMAMLRNRPVAGILIGGDEEVFKEGDDFCDATLFRSFCEGRPLYPLGATGGATETFLDRVLEGSEELGWSYKTLETADLRRPNYPVLMHRIIRDIVTVF